MRTLLFLFFVIAIPTTEIFASYGSINQSWIPTSRKTSFSLISRMFRAAEVLRGMSFYKRDGIYLSEVDDYISRKSEITAEFYDGLLIDYETDSGERGVGVAHIFHELEPNKIVVHGQTIDTTQIDGVLIWNHKYYKQPVSISIDETITMLGTEEIEELSFESLPLEEISRLYGTIVGVFTNNMLAVDLSGYRDKYTDDFYNFKMKKSQNANEQKRRVYLLPADYTTFK